MLKVVELVEEESKDFYRMGLDKERRTITLRVGKYNKFVCDVVFSDNREPELWLSVLTACEGYGGTEEIRKLYSSNCWEPLSEVDFSCNGLFDEGTVTDIKKMLEVAR